MEKLVLLDKNRLLVSGCKDKLNQLMVIRGGMEE
jgi:hypothetical protein